MLKRVDAIRRSTFLLVDDLPSEVIAMLQAFYSRSAASAEDAILKLYDARRDGLRGVLVDWLEHDGADMAAVEDAAFGQGHNERASGFMKSMYVGYNHKSIGDCGSTTLFAEGVSILAAKAIQDSPLYSGQETSTRYINMAAQPIIDPVGTHASQAILDRWMDFYTSSQDTVSRHVRASYPQREDEDDKAYAGAVKARTFDILRAWLPAGAATQLSWHTNLRQAGDKLPWLLHHPLAEVRDIGRHFQSLLHERYTSTAFGQSSGVSGVTGNAGAEWTAAAARDLAYVGVDIGTPWRSNVYIPSAHKERIQARPRGAVLPHFMADFGQITAHFRLDFGSFRDIQRQRNGVCRMPLLTTNFGFGDWYTDQLPDSLIDKACALLEQQDVAIRAVSEDPYVRQYYTALGHEVPCQVTYALPAFVYVVELRSGAMIHPTLRRVIHDPMIKRFQESHPNVPLHVNMDPDPWDVRRGTQTIERR